MTVTDLTQFWPSLQNRTDSFRKLAESISDPMLLAVHQPIELTKQEFGTQSTGPRKFTENDIFNEFLEDPGQEGIKCIYVTGFTGVGKTHLIRWLEAKIKSDKSLKEKFEIVRIPKHANLKQVVQNIIEPLKDDEVYQTIKKEMETVSSLDFNIDNSANLLRAHIINALNDKRKDLEEQRAGSPSNKEINRELTHVSQLPLLFKDPGLHDYVQKNTLQRIINHHVSDNNESDEDQSNFEQFELKDLEFETLSIENLIQQSIAYRSLLGRDGSKETAKKILNSVINDAVTNLFKIQDRYNGKTWGNIFVDLRKRLKEQGRELAFFIEDFYALTGFQKILINIFMQENETDADGETCNIRSIVGVTVGYQAADLTSYESRAGGRFIVMRHFDSDEQIFEKTIDLIGSYLNAARLGRKQLETDYQNGSLEIVNFFVL